MATNTNTAEGMNMRAWLSTLWLFVVLNIIVADIVRFLNPGALEAIMTGSTGFEITEGLILVFALLLQIPIAMMLLSRVLPYRVNRWANIIASIITILFVIGGGNTSLSYIFFATIETVAMLFIIWTAWRWRDATERSHSVAPNSGTLSASPGTGGSSTT